MLCNSHRDILRSRTYWSVMLANTCIRITKFIRASLGMEVQPCLFRRNDHHYGLSVLDMDLYEEKETQGYKMEYQWPTILPDTSTIFGANCPSLEDRC